VPGASQRVTSMANSKTNKNLFSTLFGSKPKQQASEDPPTHSFQSGRSFIFIPVSDAVASQLSSV
jgi:hypothetical protein